MIKADKPTTRETAAIVRLRSRAAIGVMKISVSYACGQIQNIPGSRESSG